MSSANGNPRKPANLADDIYRLLITCNPDIHNHVISFQTVKYAEIEGNQVDQTYCVDMVNLAKQMICKGAEYNSKKFPAIKLTYRNPKVTVMFFRDGKIQVTGSKTITCAIFVFMKTISMLNDILPFRIGVPRGLDSPSPFKVQNVVASGEFPFMIDLRKLKEKNSFRCDYEPKEFPGAALKVDKQQGTMLLFRTGTFVLTGASSHILLWECLRACSPKAENCKIQEDKREKHLTKK